MAGVRVRDVDVHRAAIAEQFTDIGQAGRWIDNLNFRMKVLAAAEAPKRSFELARSHRVRSGGFANQYQAKRILENTAEHASWVHDGTGTGMGSSPNGAGWIYPRGRFLVIPAGGGHPRRVVRRVQGQKPNPWMLRACAQIAKSVGAVEIG